MTSQERKDNILKLHKKNPSIYTAFEKKALELFKINKYHSARFIIEWLRWYTEENENDTYKINNDFSVLLARLFVKRNPKHKDRFKFRMSIFDDKDLDELQLDLFTIDKY